MKLRIIDYRAACAGQPTDGATRFGAELPRLLARAGVPLERHPFASLPRTDASLYADGAAVFSAAGPYAFLYHYGRERAGAGVPIVRDIHGGAWSGYLLQEWLCESLTRPGDVVVYPSEFARSLYARLFPDSAATRVVGHPMWEAPAPARAARARASGPPRIGAIGRLSRDKNLLDLVRAVGVLGRDVELHAVGGAYDLAWADVEREWRAYGLDPGRLVYHGHGLSEEAVAAFFASIDLLGFFSTSNIEALGRVVVEAWRAGVPTCMARHAAADELVPPEHRVAVSFFAQHSACTGGVPLGTVEPAAGARALERVLAEPRPSPVREPRFLAGPFARTLECALRGAVAADTIDTAWPLADALEVALPPPLSRDEACARIAGLLPHVRHWAEGTPDPVLDGELTRASADPARSETFLRNVRDGRVNYADTTGYPYHLAQLLGFRPTARVGPV
jgi:glycosyltransferase involved in cell wall biosynthesis